MFDRVGADSSFRSAPVNFSRSHPRVSPRSSDREATLRTHVRASHMRDARHDARIDREQRVILRMVELRTLLERPFVSLVINQFVR